MTDRRWNKSSGSSFCRNGLFLAICIKEEEETEQIKEFLTSLRVSLLVILTCGIKKINKRSVEEKEEEATLFALSDWMGSFTVKSTTEPARKTVNSQQTNISHQVAWSNNPRSPYHWVSQSSLRRSVYFSWGTTLYSTLYTSVGVAPKATHEVSNVPPPQPPTTPERNEDRRTDK